MANVKISELPAASSVAATDQFETNQSGTSRRATAAQVKSYIEGQENTFTKRQAWAKGADIASASTLALGTDGNYFDVTGTTGITAITVPAGTLFMLQFDGALTLTHHATNLALPGGANIVTAAGDRAICFAEAANQVRVLDYIQADVGSWTPTLTFGTPGDLSVAYSVRVGRWWRVGSIVTVAFTIQTSSFTHTTASGNLRITGLPVAARSITNLINVAPLTWQGISKANYTQVSAWLPQDGRSSFDFQASGSGQNIDFIDTADVPSGGTVILYGHIIYAA